MNSIERFGNVRSFSYLCTRNIKSSRLRTDSPTEPYGGHGGQYDVEELLTSKTKPNHDKIRFYYRAIRV